jgi:hypothetical protein
MPPRAAAACCPTAVSASTTACPIAPMPRRWWQVSWAPYPRESTARGSSGGAAASRGGRCRAMEGSWSAWACWQPSPVPFEGCRPGSVAIAVCRVCRGRWSALVLLTETSAVAISNSAQKHPPALRASLSLRPWINSSSNFFTRSASSWSRWSPNRRIRCTNSEGSIS